MDCSPTHLEGSRLGKGGLPSPVLGSPPPAPPPERERSMTWTTEGRSPLGNGWSWIRLLWEEWEAEKAWRGREESERETEACGRSVYLPQSGLRCRRELLLLQQPTRHQTSGEAGVGWGRH